MPSVSALGGSGCQRKDLLLSTIMTDYDMPCHGCEQNVERSKWRAFFKSQPIYAQYFKLLVLFVFALAHVFYITDFLDVFRAFEDYALNIGTRYPDKVNHDANGVAYAMQLLVDYKKNLWMSVGGMCASLSTSCFFLLLINEDSYHKAYVFVMRVIDLLIFAALPALFFTRSFVVSALTTHLDRVLRGSARIADPTEMMNRLKCSVVPRENLPLCSAVVERAIFPVIVLEYLFVLALITAAYIGLAYLIVYCIRHWFPHSKEEKRRQSNDRLYGPLVQA